MCHRIDASTCSPLPSNGYRGRPFREPCGSPPSSVLWVHTTARLPIPAASGLPWWQGSPRQELCSLLRRVALVPDGTWFDLGWVEPKHPCYGRGRELSWVRGESL